MNMQQAMLQRRLQGRGISYGKYTLFWNLENVLIVQGGMQNPEILDQTAELRAQLEHHPMYERLTTASALATFMEYHVWAVWDFMSLLKSLQRHLTCVETPWIPTGDPETRFLINEIVVGEESDVDRHGVRMSHFEMYRTAMKGLGASTTAIDTFIDALRNGQSWKDALPTAGAPSACVAFVQGTMSIIERGKPHEIASVFTYGREDVIPTMFLGMLDHVAKGGERVDVEDLRYYLQRHIDVDGDHHGPLAIRMVELLCGDDPVRLEEARVAAEKALQWRLDLWSAVQGACS